MAKKLEYKELLKSDRRKGMKQRRFKEANNRCCLCLKKTKLVLHHLTYKNVGNERKEELVVICKSCHYSSHFSNGKKVNIEDLPKRHELLKKYFILLRKQSKKGI